LKVTAEMVKELREKTNAGMMDCKKALAESEGDFEKAVEYLRKKGLATAAKRAGRATTQGLIHAYIHGGGKLGVLVEVNCETDFVARNEAFVEFVKDIAMQIAATNPLCIRPEDMPESVLEKERVIYRDQALESGKPEKVVEKIAEGKLQKFIKDNCLLEQAFVKDAEKTVKDRLNEVIASIGENIHIRRFARFQLGEQLD